MSKLISLCLFLLFCVVFGQNTPIIQSPLTLGNQATGTVLPCQYYVYTLNITNAVTVSNYLSIAFNTTSSYPIEVEVSNLPYATWGESSDISYVGSGATPFTIDILCEYTTVSVWYIAVTSATQVGNILPVNFTVLATQESVTVNEIVADTPLTVTGNTRTNAFGPLTDFFHVTLPQTIKAGQIVQLAVTSSATITRIYANTDTLAANFDQNICVLPGTFQSSVLTIDYCTLESLGGKNLYFTVLPSSNVTYTVNLSLPYPTPQSITPTTTPWSTANTFGTLTSTAVNYYSFAVASNDTAQLINVTISNVQGGTVSFSYGTALPFISCEADTNCVANSPNCCLGVSTSCQLVIQPCNVAVTTYYIGVLATAFSSSSFPITYEVQVSSTQFGSVTELSNSVFVSGSLAQAHYDQYIFDDNGYKIDDDTTLSVHLYVDQANSAIQNLNTTLFINYNDVAGSGFGSSCWSSFLSCTITSVGSCTIQLNPCIINDYDDWYVSVYTGYTNNFYERGVSYTLLADLTEPVELEDPYLIINSVLYTNTLDHYKVNSDLLPSNGGFNLVVFNVLGGSLSVYLNFGGLAGPLDTCPSCFNNTEVHTATPTQNLKITVANCDDFVDENSDEVYFSVYSTNAAAVSYSLTVEEIANYKPNKNMKSGTPYVASIGPQSSLNYTIPGSSSDTYLIVSITQIDFPSSSPLTIKLYNSTALSCITDDSLLIGSQTVNAINQYASIIVPECDYAYGDGYILVVENPSLNNINYNVFYDAPSSTPNGLGNNEAYSDVVPSNGREFFTYSPSGEDTLLIEVYFDTCTDINGVPCVGTLSLTTIDPDTDTGCIDPDLVEFQTSNSKSCVFARTSCNETSGDLYMIVSTTSVLYPDAPLGYTIVVSEFNSSVPIQNNRPLNMNIYPNQRIYHTFNYPASTGYYLPTVHLTLSNVQNGTASAVLAQTPPPNADTNCPCFDYSSLTTVEYCNAQTGEWSALVQASSANANQLVGYTIALQEFNSTLATLGLQTPLQGSLSPLQYAFFDVSGINWNIPTIISVTSTGGSVAVYTTTSSKPGTSQCGPRSIFCSAGSQCTKQLSACNSALGTPTFVSIQGVAATSYDPIGYTISVYQNTPVVLNRDQPTALQQLPANVFYEYTYQLPVTFTAPLVGFALANVSTSSAFSVAVYNEIGCFNDPLATQTCTAGSPTCTLQVSDCIIAANSTLYVIVQATSSALNFTITPSFLDLAPTVPNIAINTPTSIVVSPNSYTVFTTTITNAAPLYSLAYLITSNTTTSNTLTAYANWGSVTPDCSVWNSRLVSGSASNTFSSCCVQPGTFSVLVFSSIYANVTVVFTQVQRLTTTSANPAVNTTTPYALSPQQTQEFSITLAQTSYYDFFYVTISANVSSNFYFQHAGLAGPSTGRACYATSFSCTNQLFCVYQVPQCAFSSGLVDSFVAGTINFGVQNLQTQPNYPVEITVDYGVLSYVTLTENNAAQVTVLPLLSAYGLFPLASNSVNESVVINVDSPVTPFTFSIYNSDCTVGAPLYSDIPCAISPCNISVSTCGGVSAFLVEVPNPTSTPLAVTITAITTATFVPSPLSAVPVPRNDALTEYFSAVIDDTTTGAAYAQLVIRDYTANPNQLTIRWSITGVPVCFQTLSNVIWTNNQNGTYTANVILNSCLLTSGTYVFELISSVSANYTIAFDNLSQGNPIAITAPTSVSGQTFVNERVIYNLTITPGSVKPGQSLEFSIQNKCGNSQLYISQGTFAGPECNGTPLLSATIDACQLLFLPLSAEGDDALYLTVIGTSQSNSQYDLPAQYLLTVDIVGEPVQFVNIGLDEIITNSDNGNTVYVFPVSGVDSFVGQLEISINPLEDGGVTDLNVNFFVSTVCGSAMTLSNTNGGPYSYFMDSCEVNESGRLIYLQFSGNNTNSKFQITHTRPFIRDLDVYDEQPQNGAVTPTQNGTNTFYDEEFYSISLTSEYIENFLFTAWVANDDDDDSLAQQQAGIQLTASQFLPPSLCVPPNSPEYHSASFGNKLTWEWCEVNMAEPLYLTVNYPVNPQNQQYEGEAYPYSLFWSFGLDDEDQTTLAPNTPSCELVKGGETNYYVFALPDDTSSDIFTVEVYAINADTNSCGTTLDVSVAYGGLASSKCNLGTGYTQTCAAPCGSSSSTCSFSLNCPIEWVDSNTNISVSVHAPGNNDVSYFIEFYDTPTNAVALNISTGPILAGGDNSAAYYFTLAAPTLDATSSVVLNVEPINGNSATSMWFAYDHIPTTSCFDGFCSETTGCQIVIDSCATLGDEIMIAVTSGAQFYISASISTVVATPLALNTYVESSFPAGVASLDSVVTYTLNITDTDVANSVFGELAVLVYGVNQGSITAWVSYGNIGNPTDCYLTTASIVADPTDTPLPVSLKVNYCGFATGIYYVSLKLVGVSDSCSSVNFGVIASIGISPATQNVLTAGDPIVKPIIVGTTTTDYFTFDPSSDPEIMNLVIISPEDVSYDIQFWTSPYGSTVDNVPAQSCITSSGTNAGVTNYYWWDCDDVSSISFQITFSTPKNLTVLPGMSYSVTANTLTSAVLSNTAISAQFDESHSTEHFYTFTTDTSNSFVIDIEVLQGPAVFFSIYGGNCTEGENTYITGLVCLFGPCDIPIDWSTTGFQNNTKYYVVVDGSAPSKYSISLLAGEDQTCVPATNTSLCTMVDWNVWNYGTGEQGFEQQNAASIVFYNDLLNRFCPPCECVELSSACNDSLIEFTCTQTYRACDTTGLQASICEDSCADVEENCGYTFQEVGLPQYSCNHNFYYSNDDEICDIYGNNDTSGDKLLWLIVLIVVALILIVLIAVGAFIFYKKYQQAKRTGNYEAIQDANDSDSSSSSINSDQ